MPQIGIWGKNWGIRIGLKRNVLGRGSIKLELGKEAFLNWGKKRNKLPPVLKITLIWYKKEGPPNRKPV